MTRPESRVGGVDVAELAREIGEVLDAVNSGELPTSAFMRNAIAGAATTARTLAETTVRR